jgi:hypothetical protein
MTTAESEWHLNVRGVGVQISSRSEKDAIVRDDKSAIQLGQFLYGSPEVGGGDVPAIPGVPFEVIKNERTGPCHHCFSIAKREQGADPPTLSTLAGYFDSQFQQWFQDFFRSVGELRTDGLEH